MRPAFDRETSALHAPSSSSWWDDAFSRLLLDAMPPNAKQLVEIGCGVARAAHTLLPSMPDARYLGLSADAELVAEALASLRSARFAPRAAVQLHQGPRLPLPDGSTDVLLSLMSLQHEQQLDALLADARRVLRPAGRVVAVEPDNLGQRFYFDGVLEELNDVFHRLCLRARVARQPADIAVGPRLPQALQAAGFVGVNVAVHAVHSSRTEDAKSFFGRLRKIAEATATDAALALDSEEVQACDQAISRALFVGLPKRVGYSSHLVPVFRCIAIAP